MALEYSLVLIKPDAVARGFIGDIIYDLEMLKLNIIALKLVNPRRELLEEHYHHLKGKEYFEELLEYMQGKHHDGANVLAIALKGENAISRIRKLVGKTNPDESEKDTLRYRYGKVNSRTGRIENALHASDSPENGIVEIKRWFNKQDFVEPIE